MDSITIGLLIYMAVVVTVTWAIVIFDMYKHSK